jgi:tetratricopeptide (TPR) repeat protein
VRITFPAPFLSAIIPLVLAVLVALSACSSTGPAATEPSSRSQDGPASAQPDPAQTGAELSADDELRARTHFIRGATSLELNDPEYAEIHLNRAHSLLPDNAGVNYALARLYLEKNDHAASVYHSRRAVDLEPENKWYRLQLVEGLRAGGEYREVIRQLDEALDHHPSDIQLLYTRARIQASQGDYEESNLTYQRILDLVGPDRAIHYQRISNYSRMDDNDAIIQELLKVLEMDQGNVNTLLMLSQFYLEEDRTDEAAGLLEQVLQRNPRHPEALVNLADIHIMREEWDKAGELLLGLVGDPVVAISNKLEIVQYVLSRFSHDPDNEQLQETASMLVDTLISDAPDNGMAHAMAAEFYLITEDGEQSLHHLIRTTELMPENDAAWRQLVQTYYIEGMYEETIEAGLRAEEFIPQDAFILFFVGGAYFLKDKHEEAARWLSTASDLPSRAPFRSIILGTLGDTYASLDDWENADTAYEEAISLDPDNDVALNNYAYYLSEREIRLEEAREMAHRALELSPDNAAFLDTMGWIYFKLGDYEKAHEYIRASIETGDASAEVMEHMGDVYDKMGDPDRAHYWWQKALDKDETRTYLKERLHIN